MHDAALGQLLSCAFECGYVVSLVTKDLREVRPGDGETRLSPGAASSLVFFSCKNLFIIISISHPKTLVKSHRDFYLHFP